MRFSDADRRLASASPAAFAHVTTRGQWVPYEHLLKLDDALLRVANGEVSRLIVTMPPRHGKSELTSKYFPAWYLGRFPDRQVMLASYEAGFAATWGGKARNLLEEFGDLFGVRVSDRTSAKDRWEIDDHTGIMVTAGVGGALTGMGAHVLIIDDPVKNDRDAQSSTMRERAWDWWRSTARTRLMPKTASAPAGAVIVVQTRWNEDDLAGRMIASSAADGDQWEVVNLPALAEPGDLMGRAEGEPLCAELFDRKSLLATAKALGSYWFAALYQQRPAPAEGLLFKDEHFRYWTPSQTADGQALVMLHKLDGQIHPIATHKLTVFQVVDIAASEKQTADYTVVTTFGRTPAGEVVILDMARRRFDLLKVPEFVDEQHQKHGRPPLWVEDFGHGFGVVKSLRRRGIPVHAAKPIGEKVMRAMDAVARYEANEYFHPRDAPWLDEFEAEMKAFPNGEHDDMVDTVAYSAIVLPKVMAAGQSPKSTRARPEGTGPRHGRGKASRAARRKAAVAQAEREIQDMRDTAR